MNLEALNYKNRHIGHRIRWIRELRGLKQAALAFDVGLSQQTISIIENSGEIDDLLLEKIAKALNVTCNNIKYFNEENIFPNEELNESFYINNIINLYERLLAAEREKTFYLELLCFNKNNSL